MQGKTKGLKKERKGQVGMKKGNKGQDGIKEERWDRMKKGKKRRDGADMKKDMDLILSDPRFAHVTSDLRLRHIPKEERRVKLDSRFHSVLTDDKFYEKSTMDPRGRKGNYSTKEDLLKFYQLSSEEDSDEEEDEDKEEDREEEEEDREEGEDGEEEEAKSVSDEDGEDGDHLEKAVEGGIDEVKSNQNEANTTRHEKLKPVHSEVKGRVDVSEEVLRRVEDMNQDYARGEVLFSDDSSDDDSSTDDESEENLPEFEWGELDQDAVWDTEQDVEVKRRLRFAVCNLDWDRINAADIMILFTSFCPRGGSVTQVTIYLSEYGKQRMAEEEVNGPQELRRTGKNDADLALVDLEKLEKGKLDQSAGATKGDYEALRRYQRNRLRYYYAVVECDSVDTARAIYNECDRKPYEGAGFLLDLRYIPSDMTFDETPHDICQKIPESYEVKSFTTTALHDTRPVLTWDETDPERQKALSSAMTQAMKGSQIEDDCLRNFIASSSEEEGEDSSVNGEGNESESDDDVTKASRIAKFRALISEIDEKEKRKQEREKDLEAAFDLGEEESEMESDEEEEEEDMGKTVEPKDDKTPFEKYLDKRKAKRKARIERKKMEKKKAQDGSSEDSDNNSDDQLISDDELPEDAGEIYNDPFFAEELKKVKDGTRKENKKSKTKSSVQKDGNDDDDAKDQRNLELLLMDEDAEDKKHFSMREIIETNKEKKKKSRKKKLKKKEQKLPQKQESKTDDFRVSISDPRFSALLTSGDYNIDPSHPQFKHTQAMDSLINEMQKKRVAESSEEVPDSKRSRQEGRSSFELSALVKKVKNKTKKPSVRQ